MTTTAQRQSFFDWALRSRETGKITVAQLPNAPLLAWIGLTALRFLLKAHSTISQVLGVAATAALLVWSVLELLHGVNPFRRALGGLVLGAVVVRVVAQVAGG